MSEIWGTFRIIVGLKIGEILYLSNEHKAEGKQALLDAATQAAQPLRVHYLMEHFHAVMAGVEELQPGRR